MDQVETGLVLSGGDGRLGTLHNHERCEGSEGNEDSRSQRAYATNRTPPHTLAGTIHSVGDSRKSRSAPHLLGRAMKPQGRSRKIPDPANTASRKFRAELNRPPETVQ